MRTSRTIVVVIAALAVAIVGFAAGRGAHADSSDRRIAFLYVSGHGAQAKAWYDGAPPTGVLVQSALDSFTRQGFKYAGISSSGSPALSQANAPDSGPVADYVILLER